MTTPRSIASAFIKATHTMLMTLMADGSVTVCVLVLTESVSVYIYATGLNCNTGYQDCMNQ